MQILTLLLLSLALSPACFAEKKVIQPAGSSGSGLPFSAGLLVDGTLYVSGTVGFDKDRKFAEKFEDEMRQCLDNIGAVLKAAGMGFQDVVSVQVFLKDIELFQKMNSVYTTYFKAPFPTRTTVGNATFAAPARVEIAVTARK